MRALLFKRAPGTSPSSQRGADPSFVYIQNIRSSWFCPLQIANCKCNGKHWYRIDVCSRSFGGGLQITSVYLEGTALGGNLLREWPQFVFPTELGLYGSPPVCSSHRNIKNYEPARSQHNFLAWLNRNISQAHHTSRSPLYSWFSFLNEANHYSSYFRH